MVEAAVPAGTGQTRSTGGGDEVPATPSQGEMRSAVADVPRRRRWAVRRGGGRSRPDAPDKSGPSWPVSLRDEQDNSRGRAFEDTVDDRGALLHPLLLVAGVLDDTRPAVAPDLLAAALRSPERPVLLVATGPRAAEAAADLAATLGHPVHILSAPAFVTGVTTVRPLDSGRLERVLPPPAELAAHVPVPDLATYRVVVPHEPVTRPAQVYEVPAPVAAVPPPLKPPAVPVPAEGSPPAWTVSDLPPSFEVSVPPAPGPAISPRTTDGTWLPVDAVRSQDVTDVQLRLDWQYGVAQRKIVDVLAVHPGLRRSSAGVTSQRHLVGLQAYLSGHGGDVDAVLRGAPDTAGGAAALARMALAGLETLPTAIGPAVFARRVRPEAVDAYRRSQRQGDELVEPAFLGASRSGAVPWPRPPAETGDHSGDEDQTCTALFAVHGISARQVRLLTPESGDDVLFPPASRWRVLEVETPAEATAPGGARRADVVVHLQELGPGVTAAPSERSTARVRSALEAVRWSGRATQALPPAALDAQDRPFGPQRSQVVAPATTPNSTPGTTDRSP